MTKKENNSPFWVKADYASNIGKNLAVRVPGAMREGTFSNLLDHLSSNTEGDDKKVMGEIEKYRQKGSISLYVQIKPGEQKKCQLDEKVKDYLTCQQPIKGDEEEIELLEIIASQSLLY